MDKRCRHNRIWLIAGGFWSWCYQCGAIRKMKQVGVNGVVPDGRWVRPTGSGGENPAMEVKADGK